MASRKGIAITAAIVAGIVGASFLVWLVPQGSPGNFDTPITDADIASDVYSRHLDLAASVDSEYSSWRNGTLGTDDMLGRLDSAGLETQELLRQIHREPAPEWKQSYDLYGEALGIFAEYLGEIELVVERGDTGPQQEIDDLKVNWQDYVEQSVQAIPIAR